MKATVDGEKKVAYVTISEEGSYPSPHDLIEKLHEKGIRYWIDEKFIQKELARAVNNQPLPVAFGKDAEVDVIIGKNERKAYLVLKPAYGGGKLTPDDIEEVLASRRVVFGIDRDAIERALAEGQCNTRRQTA